jgi:outer membrane lipoprotein-sorting protein
MTRRFARYFLPLGLLTLLAFGAAAQGTGVLDQVQSASNGLTAYTATIQMIQHKGRTQSTIAFSFDFVPPNRMRIVYTDPASVKGQTMILNDDRFYTYLPSLDRRVWQDVKKGGGDQGKEMGFLYDFVTRGAEAFFAAHPVTVASQTSSYTLTATKQTIETVTLDLTLPDGKQVVRVNTADGAPVSVDIYQGETLVMEVRVLDYAMNGPIDPSVFQIPAKG